MNWRDARDALTVNSALLFGMALLMLGAGLQATLLGVRATLDGFAAFVTGAVMAGYYVGYVVGSVAAPNLVRRVGHIRVFAALAAAAAATILLQSMFVGPWVWMWLRGVSGFCFAGIYVVAESWLNDRADRKSRGMLLASYMVVLYVGLGGGQLLLNLADPRGHLLFILIGVLISLAVVPMALTAQRAPEFSLPRRVALRELLTISPLGTVGAFFAGATTSTLLSLGPVYAARSGFDTAGVATFMVCAILPAIVLQLPLGRLSDHVDRRSVLIALSIAATIAAAASLRIGATAGPAPFIAVACYGGLSLTTYALCVSHINDHLQPEQMVAASSTVLLVNGVGSIAGPLVVSGAMEAAGAGGFFASAAVMHAAFAGYAAWRRRRGASIPSEVKVRFVGAAPQAAPTGRLAVPDRRPDAVADDLSSR